MKAIIKIENGVCQYIFEDGINITVLIDGNKALLIDTGFPEHASEVLEGFKNEGIRATKIFLSHYHPDHAAGATVLTNVPLICSRHYEENYRNCSESWDTENNYRKPDKIFNHNNEEHFGKFHLRFLEAPGHSKCSTIIVINNTIANVGDLVMQDLDGKPVLPGISYDGSVKAHIQSLELIKTMNIKKLIMGHGNPIIGQKEIQNAIDDRLYYLKKVRDSKGNISLEDCLCGNVEEWSFVQFHENNISMFDS